MPSGTAGTNNGRAMLGQRRASHTEGLVMQQDFWPIFQKEKRGDLFLSLYQVMELQVCFNCLSVPKDVKNNNEQERKNGFHPILFGSGAEGRTVPVRSEFSDSHVLSWVSAEWLSRQQRDFSSVLPYDRSRLVFRLIACHCQNGTTLAPLPGAP